MIRYIIIYLLSHINHRLDVKFTRVHNKNQYLDAITWGLSERERTLVSASPLQQTQWQHSAGNRKSEHITSRVKSPFLDLPPNVFAPHGRLYDVEDAVNAVSSDHDVSSSTVVVIQCKDGIVAVTTPHQSPYLQVDTSSISIFHRTEESDESSNVTIPLNVNDDDNNDSDISLCLLDELSKMNRVEHSNNIPFGRVQWPKQLPIIEDTSAYNKTITTSSTYSSGRVAIAITVGNVVESRIFRHRIFQTLDRLRGNSASSEIQSNFIPVLARTIADQNQQRTQILSSTGRIIASTAILFDCCYHQTDNNTASIDTSIRTRPAIYRIDPSGQYWICQAVVAGRYSTTIEQYLMDHIREKNKASSQNKNRIETSAMKSSLLSSPLTRQFVCSYLSQLSIEEALALATECMVKGIRHHYKPLLNKDDEKAKLGSTIRLWGVAVSVDKNLSIQTHTQHLLFSDIHNS